MPRFEFNGGNIMDSELIQQLASGIDFSAEDARRARNKIESLYPNEGPLRRELYPKHMAFIRAGAAHRERLFIAANRVGKTLLGAYETVMHLTGRYPDWWEGRRFDHPIKSWGAGDTSKTVKEIIQYTLLGPPSAHGTGIIPGELILKTIARTGLPDAVETIYVKHASGGTSQIILKSYESGREAFQGTSEDVIWLDEEADDSIYTECLMRTMKTGSFAGGILILTFTPLKGWTNVVDKFLNDELRAEGNRFYIQAEWNDAPHLSAEEKAALYASLPPHQRDARSKGKPSLGSGAIYPVSEDSIECKPFPIPEHYGRAYALDVGWNRTAAIFGARDPETGTVYLYGEHYYAHSEVGENARAIKALGGDWMPGVIDPAARGRSQKDGQQLFANYSDQGLNLSFANNAREAGIYAVWQAILAGKLKVFTSLAAWWSEFRKYRRDEEGRIVKAEDHLMDATRYLWMSGRDVMKCKAEAMYEISRSREGGYRDPRGWME